MTTLLNRNQREASKNNLYYAEKIDQRVKILYVNSTGLAIVNCKDGKKRKCYIGDLKRIY